jgi:hypothetical protein
VGLRCRIPPRHFSQLKARGFQSMVLPWSLTDLSAWVGFRTSSPQQGVKYQLWYLKNKLWRGGVLVRKPTQALKSVKDQGNTFDWNPKWTKTLPLSIYFSCDIYKDPPPQKKIEISKLIFDTLHLGIQSKVLPWSLTDLNDRFHLRMLRHKRTATAAPWYMENHFRSGWFVW